MKAPAGGCSAPEDEVADAAVVAKTSTSYAMTGISVDGVKERIDLRPARTAIRAHTRRLAAQKRHKLL